MKLGKFTVAGYAVGLLVGVGIVATYGAMSVSSTPAFCGTCHVMAPYYDSWAESSHKEIACVDCHIPPGITAELRKKFEALSMVARYFTATWGTRPWSEIEDASCLECHERRLLTSREVFGDVLFDHGPHLTELRRGKRLKCTSCHSQIVQGSHIAVTSTTCTLCHFKGQPAGEGTARCTLCHQVPDRVVDAQGLEFDHGDVRRFGMECESCHLPPDPDEGSVPEVRCLTCHSEPERLEQYENTDLLHTKHVTEHKVDCTHCHLEIEHVRQRHAETTESGCASCHGGGHSPQRDLYAGIGAKDVPPMPDSMYRAGVRCEGCHFDDHEGETRTAGELSCMSCHGPAYRGLFTSWQESVTERTLGVRSQLDATLRLLGGGDEPPLADARDNVRLVERGRGIHNVRYSLAILDKAHDQLNEARLAAGHGALSTPWPAAPYETPCLDCHTGIEATSSTAFGKLFGHGPHVMRAGIRCTDCHATHEERDGQGAPALKIGAADCAECHHTRPAGACFECHDDLLSRTYAVDLGDFAHTAHARDMELPCTLCHGTPPALRRVPPNAVCSECH